MVVEGCGGLWRVVEGCGGLRRVVEGGGGLWRVVEGCGGLRRVVDGLMRIETAVCRGLWMTLNSWDVVALCEAMHAHCILGCTTRTDTAVNPQT